MQKTIIASFMVEELDRANQIYGTSFASAHEGYAVMLEEMDELFDEVRKKSPDQERMREEAMQVGAMAIKFIISLEKWFGPQKNTESSECRLCLYNVMTADELANVGSDPCLTCNGNFNNWQPEWDTCDDCGEVVILNADNDFFLERGTYGIAQGERSKLVCKQCYETKYTRR